jgi:hypothetical protein
MANAQQAATASHWAVFGRNGNQISSAFDSQDAAEQAMATARPLFQEMFRAVGAYVAPCAPDPDSDQVDQADEADLELDLTVPFEVVIRDESGDELVNVSWDPRWPDTVNADHPTDKMNYLSAEQTRTYAAALVGAARRAELHQAAMRRALDGSMIARPQDLEGAEPTAADR